jgi:hypothetical protein
MRRMIGDFDDVPIVLQGNIINQTMAIDLQSLCPGRSNRKIIFGGHVFNK